MTSSAASPSTAKSRFRPSLDWLLIFIPISIALRFGFSHLQTPLFITSCLAVIPIAGWMGKGTEHLAEHVGSGLGALLSATFGNAAEMIIALMALSKGLTDIVKASITGSIIGNILLVLGLALFSGGLKYKTQKFRRSAARSSATSLLIAAIALLIPTVFHRVADESNGWTAAREHQLSLAIAVVLFASYICTLVFSLITHREMYVAKVELDADKEVVHAEEESGHAPWSKGKAIGVLVAATLAVTVMSEFLTSTVEAARLSLGFSEVFVGVIVVAIIGNAAENSSAILMALRNKMDLSLGIAIGSSMQIALFVAPVLVFASYLFGRPMSLEFTIPEVVAVVVAVGIVSQISGDGESNWLEGVQLLSVYLVLGILFFFLPEVHHAAQNTAPAAAH